MPAETRRALRADHASRPPTVVADEDVCDVQGDARWVASRSAQVAQLRFADRVQGSICLTPTWGDLAVAAGAEPRLAHVVPVDGPLGAGRRGSPGTLVASRYVCLFPVPILLSGARRRGAAAVLVLGLGAGAGIAVIAHHFPVANVTVVEIDAAVAMMARRHYPLLDWLASPGGRVTIVIDDARAYAESADGPRFDVVVVDCSTPAGSPAHLRGPAFFAAIRKRLLRDDGVVAVNVLGSYRGNNRDRLAQCLSALAAAGFGHQRCLPVLEQPGPFDATLGRNHLILAADGGVDPMASPEAWAAAASLELYAGVEVAPVAVVHRLSTSHDGVERSWIVSPEESATFTGLSSTATPYGWTAEIPDTGVTRRAVDARIDVPPGAVVRYERRDLLSYARWVYSASVAEGQHATHDGVAVAAATNEQDL